MAEVVEIRDIAIICGIRTQEDQDKAYAAKRSKVQWPNSKHNTTPERHISLAVDIVPWPEQYSDPAVMLHVAGIVIGVAEMLRQVGEVGYKLRWGGDWDGDRDLNDQDFDDWWHFELIT